MYLHESPASQGSSSGNSKKGVWWTVFPLSSSAPYMLAGSPGENGGG